ncbi:hypothetical protein AX15_006461 [Amanita polypyramis BW_CC]|nr:hypothetical protein AX15_006461 [Amanita polypyramis BW_CC]
MSSFDKTVKLACKPKAAPPKSKYLDPIIAATWADEGAVSDVCKALAPRFREPNAIVVFKALIVLHSMIRNGSTDNVLSYLSSSDVLRLRNVSTGNWDGYAAPQNLQHYAIYLDTRIRAYRELKHDAIRVQAENNRDLRNSLSIEEDSHRSKKKRDLAKTSNNGPQRSKTIMGRKLRSMTVEKGLLRETRIVQKMIDSLVECRFYLDELEDELTTTALRMLVKDLLILIQACNEGVINVLEHYFEMSHVDAKQALEVYRHFCKQTEFVDEYLGVAKKLQNLLNVSIPNLKHAPVSLAGALQEYLDDPNFEQNRIEYKTTKASAERNGKNTIFKVKSEGGLSEHKPAQASISTTVTGPAEAKSTKEDSKNMIDFFSAIEEGPSHPQANSSPTASGPHNPFSQMAFSNPQFAMQPTGQVLPQQTGFPTQANPFGRQNYGHQPFSSFLSSQQTGLPQSAIGPQQGPSSPFAQPQAIVMPQIQQQQAQTNLFPQATRLPQMQQQQGTGSPQTQQQPAPPNAFSQSHLRPQPTGFLQPQATGSNPFRQTMLFPQSTGMAMFGVSIPNGHGPSNPFGSINTQKNAQSFNQSELSGAISIFPSSVSASIVDPPTSFGQQNTPSNIPPRPSSTPLTSLSQTSSSITSPPQAQPLQTHQTGSRNPFGPVIKTPPPVPKVPTLMELSMGINKEPPMTGFVAGQQQASSPQSAPNTSSPATSTFSFSSGALNPGPTDMSSVASSFALGKVNDTNGISGQPGGTPSLSNTHLPTQQKGATSISSQFTSMQPVKSHLTGFVGLKPFKPTSSFGAALLESLPAIPDDAPATDNIQSKVSSPTSPFSPLAHSPGTSPQQPGPGALNSQPTGGFHTTRSTLGQGLRPQMTGGGASNPFRASMLSPTMTGTQNIPSMPSFRMGSGLGSPPFTPSALGTQSTGAGLFGTGGNGFIANTHVQSQQNTQSLI